jgi:purine-binding chemotaxis protein CheW
MKRGVGEVNSAAEDVLVFRLDEQRFGVLVRAVVEVVRAVWVAPLPGAPPVVEGLVDYRGEILPVFDLRTRFGLPLRPLRPEDHMVVVETPARRAVLRVDRVESLEQVGLGALPSGREAAPFLGVSRGEDGLLLIHDPARFLEDAEVTLLDARLAARGAGDAQA